MWSLGVTASGGTASYGRNCSRGGRWLASCARSCPRRFCRRCSVLPRSTASLCGRSGLRRAADASSACAFQLLACCSRLVTHFRIQSKISGFWQGRGHGIAWQVAGVGFRAASAPSARGLSSPELHAALLRRRQPAPSPRLGSSGASSAPPAKWPQACVLLSSRVPQIYQS